MDVVESCALKVHGEDLIGEVEVVEYVLCIKFPLTCEVSRVLQVAAGAQRTFEEQAPRGRGVKSFGLRYHVDECLHAGASELICRVNSLVHESNGDRPAQRAVVGEERDQGRVLLSSWTCH